jgi:hypothetical protein
MKHTLPNEVCGCLDIKKFSLFAIASGLSFRGLQYYHRISAAAISNIIPAVRDAIYNELKNDYLKVS